MSKQKDMWPSDAATKQEKMALAGIKNIKQKTPYREGSKSAAPHKKQLKPRKPRSYKQKKAKKSSRPFWIGFAALLLLALIIFYVEFLVEKRRTIWPEGFSVYGIDVSHHQAEVDWNKIKAEQVSFAFMKATEGVSLKDKQFEKNWQATSEVGLIRGAYHFYLPYLSPEKQANHFINTVKLSPGDLPPVLDVEVMGRKSKAQLRDDIKVWLKQVEKEYQVRPIIYTGYTFYKDNLAGHFDDYPLWIAHYKVDKLKMEKDYKTKLSFWQHTDNGLVEGVKRGVDCNVFYGSMRELRSLCLPPAEAK